jgi:hypothetical protein
MPTTREEDPSYGLLTGDFLHRPGHGLLAGDFQRRPVPPGTGIAAVNAAWRAMLIFQCR